MYLKLYRRQTVLQQKKAVCFILLFLLILLQQATVQARMVSINAAKVNLRTSPSTTSKVTFVLGQGFPLKVLESKGKWLKVQDFEGDIGWVYAPLTSSKRYMVVKKKLVNIRKRPNRNSKLVAQAKKGVAFRTLKQVRGWAKVKHSSGLTGWVSRKLVWGW